MDNFVVTPWEVKGVVDYKKLIEKFGTDEITEDLKARMKRLFGEEHMFIRRNIYYSHRDLNLVLDDFEKRKEVFLYTGRGPSEKMHVGHMMQFFFSKWLQEKLKANLYIQLTDDEKFLFKDKSLDEIEKIAYDNALDIAAVDFDEDRTFIFKDTEYIGNMYKLAINTAKRINFSTVRAVFGFENTANIGMIFFPSLEIIPTMFEKGRCLIPAAIDQDPYWRVQRDIAEKSGYPKSAQVHSKLLPPLTGMAGKMSSSQPETAIYLNDSPETVKKKIMKFAFSGGRDSIEEHRKLGGNPDIDIAFQWLYFMFEPDDKKIKKIEEDYRSGKLLSGEIKEILIEKVNAFLERHRENREKAKEKLDAYMHSGKLAEEMWNKKL